MLDEIFELFDRKKEPKRGRSSGLRGVIGRAIGGDDESRDRRYHDDRSGDRVDRSYRHDDDDDDVHHRRSSKRRRVSDAFDFD